MQEEKTPRVSVCVVTYNQEKYIRQCLQSIVDQETDFDFEVIVGDDCSTDGTRAIVQEFEEMYPGFVTMILHKTNIGAMGNYVAVHRAARGEYVCHVDGDDWIYPGKLTKQAHHLDAHRECTLVAHMMAVWDTEKQVSTTRRNSQTISLTALLRYHPMFLHSSIMYRRERLGDIFGPNSTFIDFYLYVTAALRGDIGFIDEVLGGYRSNIGISSNRKLMPYIQAAIDLAEPHLPQRIIHCARSKQYLSYAIAALLAGAGHDFNEKLELAKRFGDNKLLIHILYRLKNWTRSIRAIVVLYKEAKLWIQFFNRPIFVALSDCKDQVKSDQNSDAIECDHADKIS